MKPPILIFLLCSLPLFADPSDDYVNQVWQFQTDSFGDHQWQLPGNIEASGEALSYEGVGENGSTFELRSIYSPTGYDYLLDTKFVAAYAPSVSITFVTADPYTTVKRTRADKGYSVDITVSGLLSPEDITEDTPAAAQSVQYTHDMAPYVYSGDDVVPSLDWLTIAPEIVEESSISQNGDYLSYRSYSVTWLPTTDFATVSGEERISVTVFADYGVEETVESEIIQVWPKTTGEITGVSDTEYESIPPVGALVTNVYPGATVKMQVYPGGLDDTPHPDDVILLNDAVWVSTDVVPMDVPLSYADIDAVVNDHGRHTIQLIQDTPWGEEILAEKTFSVDRTVQFKGNIISK